MVVVWWLAYSFVWWSSGTQRNMRFKCLHICFPLLQVSAHICLCAHHAQAARPEATLVAIHDSARPMMQADDVRKCIADALAVGAAVLGVPVKPTIKEVAEDGTVVATLQRSKLWEVQTPQVIRPGLLKEGFALVQQQGLEVTDDVSIVEAMGKPVRVTPGSYTNIKVTTPDDLLVVEKFLAEAEGSNGKAVVPA